jgi:hypothetical protein
MDRLNVNRWMDGHRFNKDFIDDRSEKIIVYRWIATVGRLHDLWYQLI